MAYGGPVFIKPSIGKLLEKISGALDGKPSQGEMK
jgi:hypothetical protein